jgi:hypothetical protein
MPRRTQPALSQAEVDALCAAAIRAWRRAPGSARRVRFRWRGAALVATHTSFRIIVSLPDGTPLTSAYD